MAPKHITFGDPEDIFDETDDGGEVTKLGALSLLVLGSRYRL